MDNIVNNNNNTLTYEMLINATKELTYPGYTKTKEAVLKLDGITRIFKVQEFLDNPHIPKVSKKRMKIVLQDIQDNI